MDNIDLTEAYFDGLEIGLEEYIPRDANNDYTELGRRIYDFMLEYVYDFPPSTEDRPKRKYIERGPVEITVEVSLYEAVKNKEIAVLSYFWKELGFSDSEIEEAAEIMKEIVCFADEFIDNVNFYEEDYGIRVDKSEIKRAAVIRYQLQPEDFNFTKDDLKRLS